MKRLLLLSLALVWAAGVARGQESGTTLQFSAPPVAAEEKPQGAGGSSLANLTPEMWLYMQELQRHDDPAQAVRRKAEERATHRQDRLASRRWFGLSNARPTASPVPTMGTYSPFWAGQNNDPNRWDGVGGPVIQVREADAIEVR